MHQPAGNRSQIACNRLTVASSSTTLRILPQDVPGTRIVTHCPETIEEAKAITGCMTRLNFWRSQTQFAPELGVDVNRIKRTVGNTGYVQYWIAGSGPTIDCCSQFAGAVKYTVFTAAGQIVRHVDSTIAASDSALKKLGIDW